MVRDEVADLLRHVEHLVPLLRVEGQREAPDPVEANGALLGDLESLALARRLPPLRLQPLVLRLEIGQLLTEGGLHCARHLAHVMLLCCSSLPRERRGSRVGSVSAWRPVAAGCRALLHAPCHVQLARKWTECCGKMRIFCSQVPRGVTQNASQVPKNVIRRTFAFPRGRDLARNLQRARRPQDCKNHANPRGETNWNKNCNCKLHAKRIGTKLAKAKTIPSQ